MIRCSNSSPVDNRKQLFITNHNIRYIAVKSIMTINSSKKAYEYLRPLYNHNEEEFRVFYLRSDLKLIICKILFLGSKDKCEVRYSTIIKNYFLSQASAIIIAHNHPSQNCLPSENDILFTKHLKSLCDTLEIKLIDHLVYCQNDYFSFYDEKLLLISKLI